MKRLTLPKSARLLNNGQFRSVLSKRVAARDGLLTLFAAENSCGHSRLGISISRLAGGAVVRNRLKRLIREAYRLNREQIPQGRDYVVMLSPYFLRMVRSETQEVRQGLPQAIKDVKLKDVERSFLSLTRELDSRGRLK